jgi:small subunit ribosomal protein S4e
LERFLFYFKWKNIFKGNTVYLQSGNNIGRVGTLTAVDSHPGSFDIVHVKDVKGVSFSTRISNAFIIGIGKA